jgi:hypothetical protein
MRLGLQFFELASAMVESGQNVVVIDGFIVPAGIIDKMRLQRAVKTPKILPLSGGVGS